MFTLRNFLLRHHGPINRILLAYSTTDSPTTLGEEYDKWYNETNKDFKVYIDLHHKLSQNINDFKELLPYLDLEVSTWDLFERSGEFVLDISLK